MTQPTNNLNVTIDMRNQPKLEIVHGSIYAYSLKLAEDFGKRHDHVMRTIDDLVNLPNSGDINEDDASLIKTFYSINFHETTVRDSKGRNQRAYRLTRDGFDLIAMGFTGPKATLWKIRYIYAFRRAELELERRKNREKSLKQMDLFPDNVAEEELTLAEVLQQLSLFGLFNSRTTANSLKSAIKRGELHGRFDGRRWLMPWSGVRSLIAKKHLDSH